VLSGLDNGLICCYTGAMSKLVKPMADWYTTITSDGKKQPFRKSIKGGFLQEIRMNHEGTSFPALQIEGIKQDDGTLNLTIIVDDVRHVLYSTVSSNGGENGASS
jgi:hypothetical protein